METQENLPNTPQNEVRKKPSSKRKWILLVVYILAGIGGILILVLGRNFLSLNFVTEECRTFGLTMLAYLKWLLIPLSLIGISFLAAIPSLFKLRTLAKVLVVLVFLALAGLSFYYNFFVNADWSGNTLSKIFNTIGYILNYVSILSWVVLVSLIPLFVINGDYASPAMSIFTILASAFLMACSGHISFIVSQGGSSFGWGLLNVMLGLISALMPIFMAYTLFKVRNESVDSESTENLN